MDVEGAEFPCLNCGSLKVQIFWSKIGERIGWSCPACKNRRYFRHEGARDQAVLIDG